MMKKFASFMLVLALLFSSFSCGEYIPPQTEQDTAATGTETVTPEPPQEDIDEQSTSIVTVVKDGVIYDPVAEGNNITVGVTDGVSYTETVLSTDGRAYFTGLDGDYSVSISGIPDGYTYDPNIYQLTNKERSTVIELLTIEKTRGSGAGLYGNACIQISSKKASGVYRANITKAGQVVYYEFTPKMAGEYAIESMVDISADMYNPKVYIYTGTSAYKLYNDVIDGGGTSGKYTNNFKFTIQIDEEFLGNCFTFGVFVEGKDATYPTYVDFSIKYVGEYTYDHIVSSMVMPEFIPNYRYLGYSESEADALFDRWFAEYAAYLAEDRERFGDTNYVIADNGNRIFDSSMFRLNPDDGYYHLFDVDSYPDTAGWGPILYADISQACEFIELPFTTVEYAGSNALTVSEGTLNYKLFIEGYDSLTDLTIVESKGGMGPYFCTSDCDCFADNDGLCTVSSTGVDCENLSCIANCRHVDISFKYQKGYEDIAIEHRCPVTEELKEFLQYYSTSNKLFCDGNGWVETHTPRYDADEESQWLFACGYYIG